MKLSHLFLAAASGQTLAHPGMGGMLEGILEELGKRQPWGSTWGPLGSTELIGDLAKLPDEKLTYVGRQLKGILQLAIDPTDTASTYTKAGPLDSAVCAADTCCVWSYIADEMAATFVTDGECNLLARGAIRFGFHDAATWERNLPFGGADGSIILSGVEMSRPVNNGLEEIAAQVEAWFNKYSRYGIGMADLIQFGAKVAVRMCPGGPRIRTFVGRIDSSIPNPDLLPDPNQSAPELIALFEAKTIIASGLVALIGAHTTSRQRFFKPELALVPQDTTPGRWDVLYYIQTQAKIPPPGILRFPSDVSLANFPSTSGLWSFFGTPAGKPVWDRVFASQYIRMSMFGVDNMNDLTECTQALPL